MWFQRKVLDSIKQQAGENKHETAKRRNIYCYAPRQPTKQ